MADMATTPNTPTQIPTAHLTDVGVAAGGLKQALFKEFPNVRLNGDGHNVVCGTASPGSPDQNAEINAIEILP